MTAIRSSARIRALAVPAALFLLALAIRVVAAGLLPVPPTEGSAWYAGVAEALVQGRGLVADAVWSYATPPLVVPHPAFDLWMPLATLIAALPMAIAGPTWVAAQAGTVVAGALIAPLAWRIGRDAAAVAGLDGRRVGAVALASGLLVALLGPLVLASAAPESTTAFALAGTVAALLVPAAVAGPLRPGLRGELPGIALGLALGAAWLARQEAIWLGATVLVLFPAAARHGPAGSRLAPAIRRLAPIVGGGLIVVIPWLARQRLAFGTPFPGQVVENLWLIHNEDIFAWATRPSSAAYLARGIGALVDDRLAALGVQLLGVLAVPAFPVGVAGIAAVIGLRRSPALRGPTALVALLVSGVLTFAACALLFPVATRWGTFAHASGPLLVGLCVVAALGGDALVARVSRARGWARENIVIAPVALAACAVAVLVFQLAFEAARVGALERRLGAVAATLTARDPGGQGGDAGRVVISDQPVRVGRATGRPAIVLPDEPLAALLDVAAHYGARWVVVMGDDARDRAAIVALTAGDGAACLAEPPVAVGDDGGLPWLLRLAPACAGG